MSAISGKCQECRARRVQLHRH